MRESEKGSYAFSPYWKVDNSKFDKETIKQHNGNFRDVYYFDIHKQKNAPLVSSHPEYGDNIYLHEHKVIKLKAASNFLCDIVLRVHYNSYVTKGEERKRCFDVIPFRKNAMFYTKSFSCDLHDSLFVDNLSLKEFAQLYNTTPAIVKRIYTDEEMQKRQSKPNDLDKISRVVVLEYHFDSEKQDCTVIFEVESGLLLFAEKGQTGEQLKSFFEKYRGTFTSNLKEIYVSENNRSYIDAITDENPDIKINTDFDEAYKIFVSTALSQMNVK